VEYVHKKHESAREVCQGKSYWYAGDVGGVGILIKYKLVKKRTPIIQELDATEV
jgi:hypothetical protein